MECLHPPFEGSADGAKLITHRLGLQSVVNVDYCPVLAQSLGITQSVLGISFGNVASPLGLTHSVVTQHGVPYPLAQSLGITQTVVHAGAFGAAGSPPCDAVFDSEAVEGQPVYVVSDTNVDLADNTTNYPVIGLTFADVTSGAAGKYITEGNITKSDWTTVVGTVSLTPGAVYYLDSVAGMLTSTPTTTVGQHVVAVARAASATKLDIEIAEPILL
jgi:hypothetical protein